MSDYTEMRECLARIERREVRRKFWLFVAAAAMTIALALLAGRVFATTSTITVRLADGSSVGTAGCNVTAAVLSVPGNVLAGSIDCRPDVLFFGGFEQ